MLSIIVCCDKIMINFANLINVIIFSFMNEKLIQFESFNPLDIFGVNNTNLEVMQVAFPKLKVILRDNLIKIIGDSEEVADFESKLRATVEYFETYGKVDKSTVKKIFKGVDFETKRDSESSTVLVHGVGGLLVKAVTVNQKRLFKSALNNDLVFAIGPAGSGKTYTAVALAVRALKNKEVKRIILARPAVEAGENLGFLPGDLKDKLDPYLRPLYDALRDMIPQAKLTSYMESGTIEIAPLAYMRGRTLDNAFVILDEAQNATEKQLKMFLTRMGKTAKFIITGDITQIDLPKRVASGLKQVLRILKDVEGIDIVNLDDRDIIRHRLVSRIVDAYKIEENTNSNKNKSSNNE